MKPSLEEEIQHLRSKATELLLREDWKEYINLYTHLISLCLQPSTGPSVADAAKLRKTLCLAFSHRAEARWRLRDLAGALEDYDKALEIEPTHGKTLISKGKTLLDLDRYSQASDCFKLAMCSLAGSDAETPRGLLEKCRRLETQSRTGVVDLSEWLINGFKGKCPELAEYVGPVEIRRSVNGGRGLFATKSVEAGTVLVITKAVGTGRGILPEQGGDECNESGRMVMWKDFVDKILDTVENCSRSLSLVYTLSTGEEKGELPIPDMGLFRPESEESFSLKNREVDVGRILKVLDVNCLTEEACSGKVLGSTNSYCGVGLWILPSFVNHSCNPNARRVHVGDRVVLHASRDIKAGEEITFAYFDVLSPLSKRREMAKRWGFCCSCERCRFEGEASFRQEVAKLESELIMHESDVGGVVVELEQGMRRWVVKEKQKGFLRASFWAAYDCVFASERLMRKRGWKIPAEAAVAESIVEAVGGDERVLKAVVGRLKKGGGGCNGGLEMERAMKLGRGTYGKVMKRQAIKVLFEQLALASNGH
ncbi:methyltransferase FGSG_00040 [Typha angustifolia]|uniref:methyltransferase FGSG_00040 n=1 Tax=Typha angustifolia TaxID=59011 RepID=UPI003C2BA56F